MAPETIRLSQHVLDRDVLNEAAWTCWVLGLELCGNPPRGLGYQGTDGRLYPFAAHWPEVREGVREPGGAL